MKKLGKQEKMTSREAHHSKKMMGVIVMFIFFMFFLVGTVSALEIDNKLTYSNEDLKVDFDNLWGLGKYYGSIELKSHPSVNYVKEVAVGNSVTMWYDFNFNQLYKNGLGEVEFIDVRTEERIDRDYSFVYWGDKERNIYGQGECSTDFNGTQTCESIIVGTEIYQNWLPYDSKDIPKGKVRIGIKVEIRTDDYVDGIWTIIGKKVSRHSVWTDSLSVNLISYYKLDLSSGVVLDSLGVNNGTNNGATRGITGKIGSAFRFDGVGDFVDSGFSNVLSNNFTVSLWYNSSTDPSSTNALIERATAVGSFGKRELMRMTTSGFVFFDLKNGNASEDAGITTSVNLSDGDFHHIVFVRNSTEVRIYVDGSVGASLIKNYGASTLATEFFIGKTYDVVTRFLNMDLDELGIWNRSLSADEVTQLFNGGNGITFPMAPTIILNSPIDNFNTTSQTINFNGTVPSSTLANVSLIIDGFFNETNSSGIEGDYIFTKIISNGDHNWTYEACDAVGCANATVRTFKISLFVENSQTFNASSFETDTETFTINITTNGTTPTNGKLIYNGTTFSSVTITNTANNDFDITKTIDIPLVAGTKEWFFNFTLGATEFNSSTQNQIINSTTFVKCDTIPSYINITFKNETVGEETVSAVLDTDWNFWLGGGDTFKTLDFTNTTENFDYPFCLTSPGNRTLNTNVSLTYDNSISQQRSFTQDFTLTNITTNQTLFLLPTEDGLFITFQTVTVSEQIISDVNVNVSKLTDLISIGITDDAGLVQFFLDPDTTYTFNFFKVGFDVVTTSLKPTQSSFTITMGTQVIQEENDTTKGISYIINPISNTLSNNTETEFNLSFFSTFFLLDNFGFALKNSTGDIFNVTSSTIDTGGFLSRNLNTGDNNDIIMEIFWTINGNQTNITRTWLIFDDADEGFSIKTFFDDLSIFLTSGMFGLTNFGLSIIIFGIILLVTGILSARFGNIVTNPPGISLIIFSLVLFFDVGLGIMPNPIGAVNNFPTIFVGFIFLGILLKEAIK
ncbi:MAG TPA: LamG domain-containing protein [bacterium]|nr:LamG domain-containing protein [bacterium]